MNIFLNSYRPLCHTERGVEIAARHKLPPYVDASIRREPDFEHKYPSITGLCRVDKLVKPAREGDIVSYVTVKNHDGRRLVAILKVKKKLPNHAAAALWYREQGLSLPSNCMVPGNGPMDLDQALSKNACRTQGEWDESYWNRSRVCPFFLICDVIRLDLWFPPAVPENIFGRSFPVTRTPCYLETEELALLRQLFAKRNQLEAASK